MKRSLQDSFKTSPTFVYAGGDGAMRRAYQDASSDSENSDPYGDSFSCVNLINFNLGTSAHVGDASDGGGRGPLAACRFPQSNGGEAAAAAAAGPLTAVPIDASFGAGASHGGASILSVQPHKRQASAHSRQRIANPAQATTTMNGSSNIITTTLSNDKLIANAKKSPQSLLNQQTSGEFLLAKEMAGLSLKERDLVYSEIHGVAQDTEETPEFIQARLHQMDIEVQAFKKSKSASYEQALFLNPTFVNDPKFRLMFLRADRYQPKKAAERFVFHFDCKKKLFGLDLMLKPRLAWDDLSQAVQDAMRAGCLQITKDCTDRSGRPLFLGHYKVRDSSWPDDVYHAVVWYMVMSCLQDNDIAQRKGIVPVLYTHGCSSSDFVREIIQDSNCKSFWALPTRAGGSHVCLENPQYRNAFSMLLAACPKPLRLRMKIHCGSNMEVQYELNGFGIDLHTFPLDVFGDHKPNVFQKRLENLRAEEMRRARQEELELNHNQTKADDESGKVIPFPRSKDVILGRGASYMKFPGNVAMFQRMQANLPKYKAAPTKGAKTAVSIQVVDEIMEEGGRFLKRLDDCSGWEIVDKKAARAKISMAFRNQLRVKS